MLFGLRVAPTCWLPQASRPLTEITPTRARPGSRARPLKSRAPSGCFFWSVAISPVMARPGSRSRHRGVRPAWRRQCKHGRGLSRPEIFNSRLASRCRDLDPGLALVGAISTRQSDLTPSSQYWIELTPSRPGTST